MVTIKSATEIEKMRIVGKMAGESMDALVPLMKAGVTALEVDRACYEWTVARGAVPATLNYKGYKHSLCVSPNDVVCHGVPNQRAFKNGDIVNLDVTPKFNGYHGDTNSTFLIGAVDPKVKKLVESTYRAMWAGIFKVAPGNYLGDIGHAIQTYSEKLGYSVVIEYCGHGIGRGFHEDPIISHIGKPGSGMRMRPGMTFTIEPMLNMGKRNTHVDEKDEWTVYTNDGSWSAQFEHTILVTDTGFEVLTLRSKEVVPSDFTVAQLVDKV